MLTTFRFALGIALLATPPVVLAQDLRTSAGIFCSSVQELNAKGVTAAPGTNASYVIAGKSGQTIERYRQLWQLAKALGVPSCQAMW